MTATLESVYQAALALPDEDQAELADRLIARAGDEGPGRLHPAWKAEVARRGPPSSIPARPARSPGTM